jgi:uncharacterized membrane protein
MRILQSPIKESVLAFLRIAVIAAIPLLINALSQDKIDARALIVALFIALLKALDEYIHTVGKNEKDESLTKGLTRF